MIVVPSSGPGLLPLKDKGPKPKTVGQQVVKPRIRPPKMLILMGAASEQTSKASGSRRIEYRESY